MRNESAIPNVIPTFGLIGWNSWHKQLIGSLKQLNEIKWQNIWSLFGDCWMTLQVIFVSFHSLIFLTFVFTPFCILFHWNAIVVYKKVVYTKKKILQQKKSSMQKKAFICGIHLHQQSMYIKNLRILQFSIENRWIQSTLKEKKIKIKCAVLFDTKIEV